MARFRLSRLAEADLARILTTSEERWGPAGRQRYRELLAAAFMALAENPDHPTTRDRSELARGIRSVHLRHARSAGDAGKVRSLTHVIYFRTVQPGLVEIVRVLHERMESSRHLGPYSRR